MDIGNEIVETQTPSRIEPMQIGKGLFDLRTGKASCFYYGIDNCQRMGVPACGDQAYSGKVSQGDRCGVTKTECNRNLKELICWEGSLGI